MTFDAYLAYCDHCRRFGREPPTREWWDMACARRPLTKPVSDEQFDADKEREGDAQ